HRAAASPLRQCHSHSQGDRHDDGRPLPLDDRSYPAKYPLRALTTVDGRLTLTSSRRHSWLLAASMAITYCWRSPSMRCVEAATVSAGVVANNTCPPVHSARSRRSTESEGIDRSAASSMSRWSNHVTVATTKTGTSMEL